MLLNSLLFFEALLVLQELIEVAHRRIRLDSSSAPCLLSLSLRCECASLELPRFLLELCLLLPCFLLQTARLNILLEARDVGFSSRLLLGDQILLWHENLRRLLVDCHHLVDQLLICFTEIFFLGRRNVLLLLVLGGVFLVLIVIGVLLGEDACADLR